MKLKFLFSCLFGFFLVSAVPTRNREIEPVVVTNIQMLALNDPKAEDWAKKQMASMTLEDKLGQFFMVAARSNGGEKHLLEIDSLVQKEKVGGIILFQGEKSNVKEAILRFQSKSEVPLFIGMDAEWGTDMRLFDGERFPFAYTIGAANDSLLSSKVSSIMAAECRDLGIHMNFSPVADVQSDPKNPVIGFRSFGENEEIVAKHVGAFVKGFEENGIMSCIKHFPGHGNTSKDSHYELPMLQQSIAELDKKDWLPFRKGMEAGASSVMIGHLSVPSLDNSGVPASLSSKIIQETLIRKMGYGGLVISDALNMKAVSDKYGKTEVVLKAFQAGCDILLYPESVHDAIAGFKEKIKKGELSAKEIDQRCLKILIQKYRFIIAPPKLKQFSNGEIEWAKKEVYQKSLTVLKNENNLLPLQQINKKIAKISIGLHCSPFDESLDLFAKVDTYQYLTLNEALLDFESKASQYDIIITAYHASTVRSKNNFGFGEQWDSFFGKLPSESKNILVLFGNPNILCEPTDLKKFDAVVCAYENHPFAQDAVAHLIFGAIPANGKLPATVNEAFACGYGKEIKWGGRLKFTLPEEIGMKAAMLSEIDDIVEKALSSGAFPGCQIVVAVKGKIIYRKSFGKHTFDGERNVFNDDLYDIASVSKIAGSTLGIMRLQTEGKFSLSKCISDYLPELVEKHPAYGSIQLREMLSHQAGLPAWIPFYKRVLTKGAPDPTLYSKVKKKGFEVEVADQLWQRTDYVDSVYEQILSAKLGPKKYEYSDLGYYFIKKIVEDKSRQSFDDFLHSELYAPMGLRSICFRPRKQFSLSQIVPTEDDQIFRKQLIHGHVHDPGAAMLGGVGGHAGVFSNATDLAGLMQLFLNKGSYGNHSYVSPDVVEEYTKAQFPGNRRGAGFDRPSDNGGGPCYSGASQKSFGHSGFTGTFVWADPAYGINYVFLSNRVCPDQNNWKIRDMNIRTEIQRVIYEAVRSCN